MVLKTNVVDSDQVEIHTENSAFEPGKPTWVVTSEIMTHGVFRSEQRTSAGTTIITSPDEGGGLLLTDLIVTANKTASSTAIVQFANGGHTIILAQIDSVNNPANLSHAFNGRILGWKNAHIDIVTTGNVTINVLIGYMKVKNGLEFSAWDALR